METIGVYPLAPPGGGQDSLASQAKTLISGMITKTRSNAAQSLLQIRRVVFEQTRSNPRTRDFDAKYKTKTENVPARGLQTV